jgi:methylthioxylose transferase
LCAARLVVGSAAVVGRALFAGGVDIFLPFPPPLAEWLPHVGPGTPVAVVVAILVEN